MSAFLSIPLRALLFVMGLAVTLLPRRVELWAGPRLGRLVLALGGFRLAVVEENLRLCFPELDDARRRELVRRNYEHYGILFFELLHFFSPIPGHFRRYAARLCRLTGREHWEKAQAKGKGVLFVSSHVGFWEMNAAAGGLDGMAPTVVTTVLKPRWLNDKITAARGEAGVSPAYHPGSVPTVLKVLRRGGSVAFMNDQYAPPPMGLSVPFFGARVHTLAAVGTLAQRTGAAVVPVSGRREPDGTCAIAIEPELEIDRSPDAAERNASLLAAKVESWVRRDPEQWLWLHRRFKHAVWPAGRG